VILALCVGDQCGEMLVQAHMGGMDEMGTFYDDCLEELYPPGSCGTFCNEHTYDCYLTEVHQACCDEEGTNCRADSDVPNVCPVGCAIVFPEFLETCHEHVAEHEATDPTIVVAEFEAFEQQCLTTDGLALVEYALQLVDRGCVLDLNGLDGGRHRLRRLQQFLVQRLSSSAEHCAWDEIDDLAQDVTSICCGGGACPDGNLVPTSCSPGCAVALHQFTMSCGPTLLSIDQDYDQIMAFEESCLENADPLFFLNAIKNAQCTTHAPPPPPTSLWHWSRSYSGITITEQNAVAAMTSNNGCCYAAVVSAPFFPGSADSYVEFTLTGDAAQSVMVGIARSDFDPTDPVTNGGYHYGAYGTAAGWMMEAASGIFYHDYVHAQASTTWTRVIGLWTNPDEPWGPTTLEAAPATPAAQPGDTIGMWLHAGSLSVYLNGELVGVMCQGLVGNFVWAADLGDNAGGPLPEGVRIASGSGPPHTCCSTRCYPCGSGTACDFCDGSCNSAGPDHCDQTHPEWADGCDRTC
jgi:hypothetical protein